MFRVGKSGDYYLDEIEYDYMDIWLDPSDNYFYCSIPDVYENYQLNLRGPTLNLLDIIPLIEKLRILS